MKVRMRDDLAIKGDLVPAYEGIIYPNEGVEVQYLTACDLDGAVCLPNQANLNFNRIKLKTGNVLYMRGIDLDWN